MARGRRTQRFAHQPPPCERDIARSGTHLSKSPAFKNATAGAVGWMGMLGAGVSRASGSGTADEDHRWITLYLLVALRISRKMASTCSWD